MIEYHKNILKLYNRISPTPAIEIYDIPTEVLNFLYYFESDEISAAFIRESLDKGNSLNVVARQCNSTKQKVRTISKKMKMC